MASTYVSSYEIVETFPHDSNAFTQGLAFGPDGVLYESDGLYGESKVRSVDVQTGRTIKHVPNDDKVGSMDGSWLRGPACLPMMHSSLSLCLLRDCPPLATAIEITSNSSSEMNLGSWNKTTCTGKL